MDAEEISTFKTVCTAGCAWPAFNEDVNARLDRLVEVGLLNPASAPKTKGPKRAYRPTEKGKELFRQLSQQGAA
jgi:hypothetical protein